MLLRIGLTRRVVTVEGWYSSNWMLCHGPCEQQVRMILLPLDVVMKYWRRLTTCKIYNDAGRKPRNVPETITKSDWYRGALHNIPKHHHYHNEAVRGTRVILERVCPEISPNFLRSYNTKLLRRDNPTGLLLRWLVAFLSYMKIKQKYIIIS